MSLHFDSVERSPIRGEFCLLITSHSVVFLKHLLVSFSGELSPREGSTARDRYLKRKIKTCEKNNNLNHQTNTIYIVMPNPYLKVAAGSDAEADPLAVKETLGAISLIKEAETTPPAAYFALIVPKSAL